MNKEYEKEMYEIFEHMGKLRKHDPKLDKFLNENTRIMKDAKELLIESKAEIIKLRKEIKNHV